MADNKQGAAAKAAAPCSQQQIAENAVKHGMDPNKGLLHVVIRTRQTENGAEITVEDDGRGFDPAECDRGGALGFDTLAAQTVLEVKKEYPEIKLHLALPYPDQAKSRSEADVAEYERIKTAADSVVYVSDHYFRGCMQKRNRALVDQSSICICYLTLQTGGTAYTVKYAEKAGIKVLNVKRPCE